MRSTSRAGRRPAGLLLLAALGLLSGCGDPVVWARFRAERQMWRANRQVERILIQPKLASSRDYERAESACAGVLAAFPPDPWATPEQLARPAARDVAVQAGRAALALARIARLRGEPERALERYERALADWGAVREIGLDAAVGRAAVFESLGQTLEASAAWTRVVAAFEPSGDMGNVLDDVLQAPRRAAALERELGREREALIVLRAGISKLERVIEREENHARAAIWWHALAEDRSAAGEPLPAIEAWQRALERRLSDARSSAIRLAMADEAIRAGAADSALVYLSPLLGVPRLETRLDALIAKGRAHAALGQTDSAFLAWDAVADDHPNSIDPAARARFLRGSTLESADRWEEARTEYRALGAAYPTHALALRAMDRIVEYHAREGQENLFRTEGLRAIGVFDRLILRQRDLNVQFEARYARARMLERVGSAEEACDAMTAFWRRYPHSYDGQAAGLSAAAIADSALHDRARAVDLYREMEARDVRTVVRLRIRARLDALGVKD